VKGYNTLWYANRIVATRQVVYGSAMIPSDRALTTYYKLSIVTMSLPYLQRFGRNFKWKVFSCNSGSISKNVRGQNYYQSLIGSGICFFRLHENFLTLDDLEGQYCNRNCISCSAFYLATAGLSCLKMWAVHAIDLSLKFVAAACSCSDVVRGSAHSLQSWHDLAFDELTNGRAHTVTYL